MGQITVWRIVDPRYAADAFSGAGAEQTGGRFNSPGRRIVYAAGSISLALLEMLVQANKRSRLSGHLCIPAAFDEGFIETAEKEDLPVDWDFRPYGYVSQVYGDDWIQGLRSLVLRVPSIVVPQEYNYLINPLHPDFGAVKIGAAFEAPFDPRLIERRIPDF